MKFIYWLESVVDWFTDMAFDNPEVTPVIDSDSDAYSDDPIEENSLFQPVSKDEIGNASNYHKMMLGGNAQQRAQATAAYHDLFEDDN